MDKVAFFAFTGDTMCFLHVMLNAIDMHDKGIDAKIIVEGSATKLIRELTQPEVPYHELFAEAKSKGLIHAVCSACAQKMGVLDAVEEQKLPLVKTMKGHPSMADYFLTGHRIMTI